MCKIIRSSSVYETSPFGIKRQENFLNAVLKIETNYLLHDLFSFIKEVEKKLGRGNTYKWGPREIDLDLLFYDNIVFSDEKLTVPHAGIQFRDFVLTPLIEIEPALFHPVLKLKISDICMQETEKNIIRIINQGIL